MKKTFCLSLALLMLTSQHLFSQTIIYVDINASGNNDGTNWTNAFNDLQSGIDGATAGDTIWVATGNYNPTGNSLNMKNGVVILGGFADTATSLSSRNWGINQTVLNTNGYSVISNSNIDSTAVLDGFILNGSYLPSGNGAAISNNASSPTIVNCAFRGSYVPNGNGGEIDNENASSPRIIDCVFQGSYVPNGNGGVIYNNASSPIITNCTFSGNTAGGAGGAIDNENASSPIITNCVFWGNNDNGSSADIYNDGTSTGTVTYSYTQTSIPGTGNIQGSVDPFANDGNATGNDGIFMTADDGLQVNASAQNSGTPDTTGLHLPSVDIIGNPRIGGTTIDMGAYEAVPLTSLLYVDANYGNDANIGSSWIQSLQTLNQALLIANADTAIKTVYMATGYYYTSGDPDSSFTIYRGGIKIYGGYPSAGDGTRDLVNDPTYLEGNSAYHVMVIAGINSDADSIIIDGVNIQNGNATGPGTYSYNGNTVNENQGGGIAIINVGNTGEASFNHCTFNGNHAVDGGALYVNTSIPLLSNCLIAGNLADESGAGIYNQGAFEGLFNCTISGNNAVDSGGAVYNDVNSSSVIVNSIVWGNSSGVADISSSSIVEYSLMQDGQYSGGTGNVSSDPFFINAPAFSTAPFASGNYHLQICNISPAFNAGDTTNFNQYIGNTDIEGNPRVSLGAIDMGAYEMSATPVSIPVTVYVDSANGNDANRGDSWAHAFKTLGYALNQANNGTCTDTILVAKGTYYPTGVQSGTNRHSYFAIFRNGIKLFGGYDAGTGLRDIANDPVYLDGDIGTPGDSTDNSYHVMIIVPSYDGTANSTIVDGFTVRNGNANVSNDNDFLNGNFIYSDYGGGLNANGYLFLLTISNCTFTHNNSISGGGGMTFENSGYTINNCTITANTSSRGAGFYSGSGGGFNMNYCNFTGNYTTSGGAGGAGIFCTDGGSEKIINCSFNGNYSKTNGGGLLFEDENTYLIQDCLFAGNVAEQSGAGIYTNATAGASPVIFNCTFSGNKAFTSGGAIKFIHTGGFINTAVANCILWGDNSEIDAGGYTMSVFSSIVQGGYNGVDLYNGNSPATNPSTDPLFVDQLPYSSAPFTGGNYSLQPCGSPAINAGTFSSLFLANTLATDLAGNKRVVGAIDYGAYEFDPSDLPVPTTPGTYQSEYSFADGNITHFYNCTNLLLSLNLTGTGAVVPANGVKVQVDPGATYYPDGTGFVTNITGTVLYNRQWTVNPTVEPSSPVTVYSYYTDSDYISVNDTLAAHGLNMMNAETQMYCYKITDNSLGDFPAIATTSPSNVLLINSGLSPGTAKWIPGTFGTNKYEEFEVSSFTGGGGGGNPPTVLPVELISFTGKGYDNYNLLNWQMVSTTTSYFEVQRSSDGVHFNTIGNEKVQTMLQTNYDFDDEHPLNGINYYRLRITDNNGTVRYSNIIEINDGALSITVYPNPAKDFVMLTANNGQLVGSTAILYDISGKALQRIRLATTTKVLLHGYAQGTYLLKLDNGETYRIIVAH